jgi:Tfp pilus assembly protein PilF
MIVILTALLLFQAADYSAEGMKALQANNFDSAVDLFTKAIGQDPKDYGAHFDLALAYSLQKKDALAIPEYQKALELKPGLYEAQLNLGLLLLRNQRPRDAIPQLEAAVAQKPKEVQPNFNLAASYMAAGQPEKAEARYRTVLEIAPVNPNAELGLARALITQNRLADAAPHFRKAAELDPKLRDALLELAQNYEEAKQPAEAIAIYQQFPDNAGAQERLGGLLLESKNYADAIPRLEKAVAGSPSPANRLALATAYRMNKEPQKELDQLAKAVASAPKDYDLRMTLGRALRDRHQLVPASQQFLAAAQIKPDSVSAWNELASALIISENYTQGLAALDRVKALGKETPGDMFYRAITLDKLRQLKPALESYEQFLAADNGAHPDQDFQARQRARIIKLELSKK